MARIKLLIFIGTAWIGTALWIACLFFTYDNAFHMSQSSPAPIHIDDVRETISSHSLIEKEKSELKCEDYLELGYISDLFGLHEFAEDQEYVLKVNVDDFVSKYFVLCIAKHDHQHSIEMFLQSSVGDCDFFLSSQYETPSLNLWDWKSTDNGADSIKIYSYAIEFKGMSTISLYVAINGKDKINRCELKLRVGKVTNEQLLHKIGSLRGGKILLPRDIKKGSL